MLHSYALSPSNVFFCFNLLNASSIEGEHSNEIYEQLVSLTDRLSHFVQVVSCEKMLSMSFNCFFGINLSMPVSKANKTSCCSSIETLGNSWQKYSLSWFLKMGIFRAGKFKRFLAMLNRGTIQLNQQVAPKFATPRTVEKVVSGYTLFSIIPLLFSFCSVARGYCYGTSSSFPLFWVSSSWVWDIGASSV